MSPRRSGRASIVLVASLLAALSVLVVGAGAPAHDATNGAGAFVPPVAAT
jgi:hypothetical protein